MPKGVLRTRSASPPQPWWLMGGDEECPHCGQLYIYELEFRCPDCDSPSCPDCKQHAAGRVVCISCITSSTDEASHG